MIFVAVMHIVVQILVECLSFHLSVVIGDGDNLMFGKLHSTSLVYINMSTAHTNHTFVLVKHRVDGGGIGLGASSQKEYLGIG